MTTLPLIKELIKSNSRKKQLPQKKEKNNCPNSLRFLKLKIILFEAEKRNNSAFRA